ncbi:Integrase [Burkholderia lata]|uniref:tyrosine-type recombinase/integrase n=1 Tax=Burkholderia lata (strain ATCC 17760 / DSM 23089 / LMG 22485 / NCIMB 9086 / R18194 / 383) TaxID=482957 RepID=UPI0014542A40|nr:tyrosine-type recombinase/integrase [Burkholderia lata]VWC63719.1 Integrase [Burkholderia lata]
MTTQNEKSPAPEQASEAATQRPSTENPTAEDIFDGKIEFLDLSWPQVDRKAGHIRVKRAKQRGEVIEQVTITPPLAALLDRLEAIRGDKECPYVFTTKFGTHYTRDGFKGFWGKLMNEAIESKVIAGRFTFHDLRAYYPPPHKSERGALPDLHANPATTARVYDRNKIVKRKTL